MGGQSPGGVHHSLSMGYHEAMSDEAKVEIRVLHPANPLAPLPKPGTGTLSDIDTLLLKLPEWEDNEVTIDAPTPDVLANPVSIRVGVAKPREGGRPIRRSRITRTDVQPGPVSLVETPKVEGQESDTQDKSDKRKGEKSEQDKKPLAKTPQERVRNLSHTEQQRVARKGELADRVALERTYGKAVWETLLGNSRLTTPEVLRIARMASLPIPLIEIIVSNRGWLGSPQVRRALLANRRLTKDMIMTVLRATPKSELRLMNKQTAYPALVREAAAKILK